MQASPVRDLVVGLFVFAGLVALAYLTFQVGGLSYRVPGGLVLYATFDDIGGLKERAPISISGVKVGQVESFTLDDLLRALVGAGVRVRLCDRIEPDLEQAFTKILEAEPGGP